MIMDDHTCVLWLLLEAVLQEQQIGSFFRHKPVQTKTTGESDSHKGLGVGKQRSE